MKQRDRQRKWAQRWSDWVWDRSRAELERLEPNLAARLARRGLDLRGLLACQADETLALAVQKGFFVVLAFTELLRNRYEERMLGWFLRWRVEANTALDLKQELFLKFHDRQLKGYDPNKPNSSFSCYLRQAAYNLYVTRCYRGHRPVPTADLEWVPGTANVEDEAERHEAEQILQKKLAELPDPLRAVMELHLAEYPPEECAERLGITVKQFYGRLFRARCRLAAALDLHLSPSKRGRPPKKDRNQSEDRTPEL